MEIIKSGGIANDIKSLRTVNELAEEIRRSFSQPAQMAINSLERIAKMKLPPELADRLAKAMREAVRDMRTAGAYHAMKSLADTVLQLETNLYHSAEK